MCQQSVFRRFCIQNVKDGIQIQVYNIINDSVNHSHQFISVKVEKNLRTSQAQFREKSRKLRVRQNNDFSYKKNVYPQSQFSYTDKLNKLFHFYSTEDGDSMPRNVLRSILWKSNGFVNSNKGLANDSVK